MNYNHLCITEGLNPFVQVFYSNGQKGRGKARGCNLCLNPFVQVFYSNWSGSAGVFTMTRAGLNPFVQVFYSNKKKNFENYMICVDVLIPLFRSFILIPKQKKISSILRVRS